MKMQMRVNQDGPTSAPHVDGSDLLTDVVLA
jgi:hypothetical protein